MVKVTSKGRLWASKENSKCWEKQKTENKERQRVSGIGSRKFYGSRDICNNLTKISVFEQNVWRIKTWWKPEASDVDEALLLWLYQERSDNVPVSGSLSREKWQRTGERSFIKREVTTYRWAVLYQERSDTYRRAFLYQERSDNLPVSGPFLVLIFVLHKF
jgi:hypothetical protein